MKPQFLAVAGLSLAVLLVPGSALWAQDAAQAAQAAARGEASSNASGPAPEAPVPAPNGAVPASPAPMPVAAPQAAPVPAPNNRLPVPKSGRAIDPRLQFRHYDPHRIIRMEGRANVQASIAFDDDERIENVAVGDANSWQVTPSKRANLLFVKPLGQHARTNMTVVTDRRTYLFDLVAGAGATPVYMLRFIYPQPDTPKAEPAMMTEAEAQALALKLAAEVQQPNFGWTQKGDAALFPMRLYDLAGSTYLAWAATRPIPAILVRDSKGVEGPVNYAVQNGVLVMDSVPGEIILRLGKQRAVLTRDAAPAPPPMAGEPMQQGGPAPVAQATQGGL